MTLSHPDLLAQLEDFAKTVPTSEALMEGIATRLHENMTRYNWVGFYLVDPANSDRSCRLVLSAGSFMLNARIPLNQGLGVLTRSGQTVVVDDVLKDPRYLLQPSRL